MKGCKKFYVAATVIAVVLAAAIYFIGIQESEPHVAVFNGEKILLNEYLVYLIEQQKAFEETGGADIWDTDFDGEPAIETAKGNALDSIIYVKTAAGIKKEQGFESAYTKEELDKMVDNYFSALSENQKQIIGLDAVSKVVAENALLADLSDDESVSQIKGIIENSITEKNPAVWDNIGYLD